MTGSAAATPSLPPSFSLFSPPPSLSFSRVPPLSFTHSHTGEAGISSVCVPFPSLPQTYTSCCPSHLSFSKHCSGSWDAVQLYNELFYDLLAPENPIGGRPALRLKEDLQGRVFVDGLSQVIFTFSCFKGPRLAMRNGDNVFHVLRQLLPEK